MKHVLSTSGQRKSLYRLFGYCKDTEAMHVGEMTNGSAKTAKELTMHQADQLKKKLVTNWAKFNIGNQQHNYILSLMRQLGWTIPNDKHGEVADMARLSNFLKSKKSPVPKPLQQMDTKETSKLISCLESMITKKYK
ncbi:hypothetical protein [Winogradskyella luteola]|uniref:Uncharacterized protein n=1 Tax=Winogradskyella luteola TaxID=2828330 RepID=A0A9X1F735_9FLAO|nr:hypothetical protein [Winogradskyella luteola]MBV7268399.1 hypothetical protein [Winogradskyella luteola]